MSKAAIPGRVKTRLAAALGDQAAAAVHRAMRRCVLRRLAEHFPTPEFQLVLAADHIDEPAGDGAGYEPWAQLARDQFGYDIHLQGDGDLGQRMTRIWQAIGSGPAAFFGTDTPDLPAERLQAVANVLSQGQFALGPTSDGGYWTLASGRLEPALLRGIDWGTQNVYHQTLERAQQAEISMLSLQPWHDVDEPTDLTALRQRLANARDPALAALRAELAHVCEELQS